MTMTLLSPPRNQGLMAAAVAAARRAVSLLVVLSACTSTHYRAPDLSTSAAVHLQFESALDYPVEWDSNLRTGFAYMDAHARIQVSEIDGLDVQRSSTDILLAPGEHRITISARVGTGGNPASVASDWYTLKILAAPGERLAFAGSVIQSKDKFIWTMRLEAGGSAVRGEWTITQTVGRGAITF